MNFRFIFINALAFGGLIGLLAAVNGQTLSPPEAPLTHDAGLPTRVRDKGFPRNVVQAEARKNGSVASIGPSSRFERRYPALAGKATPLAVYTGIITLMPGEGKSLTARMVGDGIVVDLVPEPVEAVLNVAALKVEVRPDRTVFTDDRGRSLTLLNRYSP